MESKTEKGLIIIGTQNGINNLSKNKDIHSVFLTVTKWSKKEANTNRLKKTQNS